MLLGVTGSIAAYKAGLLARLLVDAGADVRVILTHSAERFVGADTFAALTGNPVQTSLWDNPGEVVHVHLAHDIDVAVVAPATANVIAKLAHGDRRRPAHVDAARDDQPVDRGPRHAHRHVAAPRHGRERRDARRARGRVRGPGRRGARRRRRRARPPRRAGGHLPRGRARGRATARSGRRADGRHRRPDPGADRPRSLHREPLDGQDGRRGRRGGVGSRGGRPPDPRSGHGPGAGRGARPFASRPPRRCIAPSCRRPATRTSS